MATLKMGERYEMLITLRYGALFTGTVIDAETRKPLPNAAVKIVDEMSKVSTTNNDGTFSIEARKLSGLRTVEIFRTGYITDTVNVTLDKSNNLYHFELYRKTRRLRVEVWAKNNYQEGIVVALPDVPNSWKTDYGKPEGQLQQAPLADYCRVPTTDNRPAGCTHTGYAPAGISPTGSGDDHPGGGRPEDPYPFIPADTAIGTVIQKQADGEKCIVTGVRRDARHRCRAATATGAAGISSHHRHRRRG